MLPADMIDTTRYDIVDPKLLERCRTQFRDDGVCVLPGFLRPDVVASLVAEADALAPFAHYSFTRSTVYLGRPDPEAPAVDPRSTLVDAGVAAVAYDLFPADSMLRALYEWDGLMAFVRAALDEPVLHRYADPFGALNIAVMRDGDELGWHFDFTDFVVSIALQASTEGGDFENAKKIRSADDENRDVVSAVLAGERPDLVRTEPMTPGTLMLFNGRWSMHRVTTIVGDTPRYVALLSYDRKPGADSTDLLKMNRYGRLPGAAGVAS